MKRFLCLTLLCTGCNVTLLDPGDVYLCDDALDCTDGYTCFEQLDGTSHCVTELDRAGAIDERRDLDTEIPCTTDCPEGLECHPNPGYSTACPVPEACRCVGPDLVMQLLQDRLTAVTTIVCTESAECGPNMECQADDEGRLRCIGWTAAEQERAARQGDLLDEPCASQADCDPGGLVCQADERAMKRCITIDAAATERAARTECPDECPLGRPACHSEPIDGETVYYCRATCDPFTSDPNCEAWEVCDTFLSLPRRRRLLTEVQRGRRLLSGPPLRPRYGYMRLRDQHQLRRPLGLRRGRRDMHAAVPRRRGLPLHWEMRGGPLRRRLRRGR